MAQTRKNAYSKTHPAKPEQTALYGRRARENTEAAGARINAHHVSSWGDILAREVKLEWFVGITYPFMYSASKNHIHAITNRGHLMLRKEAQEYRDGLAFALRAAMGQRKAVNNKVWLDLFIQKPNHKGDAVNIIDLICDGVKVALGVDDRWFCIRRLDWEIAKKDPHICLGVGQENVEAAIVCSSCGRILPLARFSKNKNALHGVSRNCNECRRGHPLGADSDLFDAAGRIT